MSQLTNDSESRGHVSESRGHVSIEHSYVPPGSVGLHPFRVKGEHVVWTLRLWVG